MDINQARVVIHNARSASVTRAQNRWRAEQALVKKEEEREPITPEDLLDRKGLGEGKITNLPPHHSPNILTPAQQANVNRWATLASIDAESWEKIIDSTKLPPELSKDYWSQGDFSCEVIQSAKRIGLTTEDCVEGLNTYFNLLSQTEIGASQVESIILKSNESPIIGPDYGIKFVVGFEGVSLHPLNKLTNHIVSVIESNQDIINKQPRFIQNAINGVVNILNFAESKFDNNDLSFLSKFIQGGAIENDNYIYKFIENAGAFVLGRTVILKPEILDIDIAKIKTWQNASLLGHELNHVENNAHFLDVKYGLDLEVKAYKHQYQLETELMEEMTKYLDPSQEFIRSKYSSIVNDVIQSAGIGATEEEIVEKFDKVLSETFGDEVYDGFPKHHVELSGKKLMDSIIDWLSGLLNK